MTRIHLHKPIRIGVLLLLIASSYACSLKKKEISAYYPPLPSEKSQELALAQEKIKLKKKLFFSSCSKKLGIPLSGKENIKLYAAALKWLGTPYKWGGCTLDGVDCSCLVKAVYRSAYGVDLHRTTREIFKHDLKKVKKNKLREGDILFFNTKANRISHVGIYLKNKKFIHASFSKGVMINSLDQNYYRKRFMGAGRHSRAHGRVFAIGE